MYQLFKSKYANFNDRGKRDEHIVDDFLRFYFDKQYNAFYNLNRNYKIK